MSCRRWVVIVLLGGLALPALARGDDDSLKSDVEALKAADVDTDGKGLLDFFKKRTLKEETRKKIETFVSQLGDDKYETRDAAQKGLVEIGVLSRPMLVAALRSTDFEVVRRARFALLKIGPASEEAMLLPCAARVLVHRKPAGAAEALLGVLPCIEDADAAEEVAQTLWAVTLDKNKKPHLAVIAALKDRDAIKRYAAGIALARVGGVGQREGVRKLLDDKDNGVRRRVALALLESKDKEAVPTLIELLKANNNEDVYAAEDALFALAGEKAPASPSGDSPKARETYVKAWSDWWKDNEAKVDLKKVDFSNALRNLTLLVTLDIRRGTNGSVYEVDANNKERWRIDNIRYPVFATMIRNDRVLICELYGQKVTERDLKGNVKWEKTVNNQAVMAQRLRNGNTFIVTRNQLQEVDKDGKEARPSISRPGHDVLAAHKDAAGKITLVTNQSVVRLEANGTEIKGSSYSLGRYLSAPQGFKVHFLPKGGVVIPDYSSSKVREYDAKGKVVWEADANRATSAVKLRNGNILVASLYSNKVWEINYKTKEIVTGSEKTFTNARPVMADKR